MERKPWSLAILTAKGECRLDKRRFESKEEATKVAKEIADTKGPRKIEQIAILNKGQTKWRVGWFEYNAKDKTRFLS